MFQADPYLRLVDDCKLVAAKSEAGSLEKVYGSKEDDEDGLKSLAAVEISETQTADFYASMIVKMIGIPANVIALFSFSSFRRRLFTLTWSSFEQETSALKEQLLNDFLPDDVCPLGSQIFNGKPLQIYQFDSKVHKTPDTVIRQPFTDF